MDNPERAGYVELPMAPQDRLDVVAPKISYVELFEPWGWWWARGVSGRRGGGSRRMAAAPHQHGSCGAARRLRHRPSPELPLRHAPEPREGSPGAIRHTEERFRTVFATSPMGIAVNRMKGGAFLDVNPAFERLTGFSREELLGRNALEVESSGPPRRNG